jgi:hypothetical protein
MKNLFSDPFEHIQATRDVPATEKSPMVESSWVDKRTGAEYRIKEQRPEPDGDFRVTSEEASSRYRSIMGLPQNRFFQEPSDFEDDRKPEPAVMTHEIESNVRRRILGDVRRQQYFGPTNEPVVTNEWIDHEDYSVDPHGRVRDKPANREGPYGKVADIGTIKVQGPRETAVAERPSVDGVKKTTTRPDILEDRLEERRGTQVLLANAFRGLFGAQVADHIINTASHDARQTFDRPVVSRMIMDAGLMKPWMPKENLGEQRIKPDALVIQVGQRALQTLMRGPLASELQDLPKYERDDIILALGRTILNAVAPSQSSDRPSIESSSKLDLQKTIALALSPNIIAGLVPPELLDTPLRDQMTMARVAGPTQKAVPYVERAPVESKLLDEMKTLPPRQLGSGHQRQKRVFDFEESPMESKSPVPQIMANFQRPNTGRQGMRLE